MYSNTVIARSSYTFKEFVYGAKFKPMYHPNQEHSKTVLELGLLNAYEKVPMTLKPAL
jgi:inward rectifier potassium channel